MWFRDLAMGARFAVTGGREGWVRTVLTAVGVGLGVALLLVTTAIPHALQAREARGVARSDITFSDKIKPKADNTLILAQVDTVFRGDDVRGRIIRPEGPKAPLPPGVPAFPGDGEVLVSPALAELLKSGDAKLLADRIDGRITGTIGDDGLIGPHELSYIKGSDTLQPTGYRIHRLDAYGSESTVEELDPRLLLLTLIIFIVLLMPVAVFIATAVRFGGERRDRRLAALRLIGADGRMARRIAAGEAAMGALLGLLVGGALFMAARELASRIRVMDISVFPHDLSPAPALVVLVALAVPAAAVVVTLFALRGVVIEPLGVVRTAKPARRRLWWRLLLPLAGLALLYPMIGQGNDNGEFNQWMVTGGVVLLLIGITAILPWLVEAVVARLGRGPVSWQLAVRRLQLSSGSAARLVNGIAVAVAGAIALQMLFAGVSDYYTTDTGQDPARADLSIYIPQSPDTFEHLDEERRVLERTPGVTSVTAPVVQTTMGERRADPSLSASVTSGSCAALREVATLPSCKDGDVFRVEGASYDEDTARLAKAGGTIFLEPSYGPYKGLAVRWKLPADLKKADARTSPTGGDTGGLLVTSSALPTAVRGAMTGSLHLKTDRSVADVSDEVRTAVARIAPLTEVNQLTATERSRRFDSIRTGLFVGATCVLLLIGASLLVSQLEQLRERRKLLAALVAFGTRRRTLSLSVLWQTAVPIALGLLLAAVVGLGLGLVLLGMVASETTVEWSSVLMMTGVGAGVVLAVTLLSLPPLWKLMRPEGLRTE
ncbi:FtsX-like permease family protein [Streptomyces sp. NPDC050418]|uniref:FtsX-like permease family protein n=1 Tax=Streptomyces sp. NPDC050418 TaxID=3365612 RepID=UPI003796BFCD